MITDILRDRKDFLKIHYRTVVLLLEIVKKILRLESSYGMIICI